MSIQVFPPTKQYALPLRSDDQNRDSFNRIRISSPETLFDNSFKFDKNPNCWGEILTGSGVSTFSENGRYVAMQVSASAGRVVRQSLEYIPYQPGKSKNIFMTGVLETSGGKAGVTCRIGSFDDHQDKSIGSGGDGLFFQLDNKQLSVVIRSYVTGSQIDTVVTQENWNIDRLDGTGPSGVLLDVSRTQIFSIDIEWLGVGSVRFGFVIDGLLIYCHKQNHANLSLQTPYMRTATLPIRYEISSIGSEIAEMRQICSSVASEGGYETNGPTFSTYRSQAAMTGTFTPIIALRPNILRARSYIIPTFISAVCTSSSDTIEVVLLHNPVVTGGSWSEVSSISVTEQNISAVSISGGQAIVYDFSASGNANSGRSPASSGVLSTLKVRCDIQGTAETIVLAARALDGAATASASIQWQEVY
jgi:hypothetical protein